ncbi:hypothetical protein, partial [Lacticaseibacillus paracasei]|uniref:hypothetical protein n=1 Tax=Lacticaseibacillus paracasei TaxID=1597 RepID=UPI00236073BF
DAAAEAWDSMLDVGRPDTPEERLQSLQEQLAQRLQRGPLNSMTGAAFEKGNQRLRDEIALLQDSIRESRRFASAQAETAAQVRAAIEAEKEIDRIRKASMSNQQKLTAELDKYRKNLDAIRRANPTSELLDPRRIAA